MHIHTVWRVSDLTLLIQVSYNIEHVLVDCHNSIKNSSFEILYGFTEEFCISTCVETNWIFDCCFVVTAVFMCCR